MHHFSVLLCCCLAALANADKLGYNYQPVAHSGSGLSFAPGGSASNLSPSFTAGPSSGLSFAPSGDAGSLSPSQSVDAPNYAAAQPELQKEFFTYTADEEDFQDPAASDKVSTSLNKALRVVFVKGPEHNGLEQAALALAKQAAQQETAIYVLNKQADIGDLANKLNAIRSNTNNKPEVHFVKYRTPEDAANAQHAIQGQYDQLGGSSQAHDGGVAPALNFASSAPAPVAAPAPAPVSNFFPAASDSVAVAAEPEATEAISSYIPPVTPGSTYLPANILRRLRIRS
ncbi:uncharacterized protein LOC117792381 [Drosophila innubila]|uniref:uncharacterized protein LOC117792381 n=1 Tax=Drosophila innubila TaxID=198719 RepID=UPI00148BE13B|nr:uncharacterized protein LOC117792381 [Drosophila innubila]